MDIVELGMDVDSRPLKKTGDEMDRFVRQGKRVDGAAQGVEQSSRAMAAGVSAAAKSLVALVGAAASVSAVNRAAQSYTQMTNIMRSMGQSADQAAATIQAIADVASRTRAPLEATAQLYQRISIAGRDLGASQQEILRFTENVGLALAQSGTSATEASGALLQLSQAMAGGTVRAEEFNSILEGAFPIALAAAEGIDAAGGSVGRLRQLVIDGKISSDAFFNAILSQTDSLEAAFANTDATIGQAIQRVSDNFTLLIGNMDQATGASTAIAESIIFLAENLQLGVTIAGTAAVAFGTRYVAATVLANTATLTLAGSMVVLRRAFMATGIGALIIGAGTLVDFLIRLRSATGSWGGALEALGDLASGVWEGIKTSAQSILPSIQAVWMDVQAGFLAVLENMALRWGNFLWSLGAAAENIPGLDGFAQSFKDASDKAIDGMVKLNAESSKAAGGAIRLREEAASLATQGFDKAREAAARLAEIVNAEGEVSAEASEEAARLAKEIGGVGKASGKTEKEIEGLRKEVERLEFEADPIAKYNAELADLQELREFGLSDDAFQKGVQDLNDELADQIPMVNDVADAWGEFVADGFRDFKGFADSVLDSFKSMISQMISTAARNRILLSLGVTGAGAAGGTAAAAGGLLGGGGGGGLLGGAGILGGILGTGGGGLAGLAGSGGILGGIGSVASGVSGILSGGGLGASFANLGGLLSGSAGGLGAIGAALPALGVVAAGVGLIVGFFKKSKELINKGVRVVVEDEMTSLRSFQDIKTSKFFGLSSSTGRSFSDVPEEFRNAWNDTMSGITSVLGNAADQLGLAGENFMSVWDGYNLDIATKGLSEDQVQQKVNEVFQQLANDITQYGLEKEGVGHLIENIVLREGEGLSDAFQRLGNTLTSANATLKDLDLVLFDIGVEGANAAAAFTDLFGGMQAFNESASFYMQNFFSEQERLEKTTAKLTDAFGDLGVTMPNTRAQFRAMVEEASRLGDTDLVAAMLQLSPAFAEITNQITNDAQSLAGAQTQVAEAYRALETAVAQEKRRLEQEAQSMIAPLRAEIRSVQADADAAGTALNDAFSALSDFVSGEIDRINEVADAAIVPLREEIETLGDAAQDAQDALEAAFAQVEDNIAREINAIREATEAASGPLRAELDALRTTANDASAALAAARSDLDALITDRIAALQSELSDAVAGFEDTAVAARSAADAARTALGAAFDQVETNINREIAAIQSATDDAIVPLEAEIDALRATADATSSALSAARSDFDSFISGRISSIEAGLTDAVRPLEDELDALRTAASEASRALESARSELEGLISSRISNIEANLSSAVSDLEAVSEAARNAASAAEDVFRNTFDDLTESLKAERAVIAGEFEAELTSLSNALDRASGGLGNLRSIIELVDGAVSSIGPLNEAIELRQRRAAQAQLAGFAGGASFTPDDLESAIGGLGGDPTKFFSDRSSFEMDQAKTRAALVAIGEDAGSQLSSAERQIQLLERQIETTEATRDAELAVIDEQIAQAERLFNETLKIAANTTALDASMTGLRAAADDFLAKQIQAAETEARIADEIATLRQEAASQIEELRAIRDAVLGSEGDGPETIREAVAAFNAAVSADADARAALEIRGASIEAAILTLEQNAEAQIAELQSIRDAVLGTQPVFANVDEGVQAVRAAAAADAEAQAALVEQTGVIQGEITSLREGAEAQIAVLQEQLAQAQATFDEATGATQAITDVDASVRALHQAASNYLAKLDEARSVEEQSAAAIKALREETAAQIAELEAIRDASLGAQEGVQTVAEAVAAVEAAITADAEAQSALAERGAVIEAELTALRENADAQVAALEAQLEQAQAAFDAATGADQAITDVADSVDALHLAIEAAAQAEAAFQSAQAANTDQIDAINAARDAQIAKLEEQLALAQEQFDEARGQSEGITSIDAGISAFNDALATFTEAQSIVDSVTAANEGIIASIEAGLAADIDALDQQLDAFSDLKDETIGVADAVANVEAAIDRLSNVVDGQMAESEKENERMQEIIDTLRDEVTARFAAPVQQLYQETLGRDAGQTALDNAVTALREGQITQSDLRQQLRTSTEYRNNVWPEALDAAAQAALGRDATAADEALYWKLWKERGATMADIQAAMEASLVPETPARVDYAGRDRLSGKAGGGMFGGGVRMVGETGPELEVTGPSRIYNHGETSRMLDNRHVVEELRALRGEVSMLRDENAQLQASSIRFAKKTSDTLKKFDVDGLPKERA